MTFAVFRGRRNIGVKDFKEQGEDSDIRIAPVMEGAKKAGVFQSILGAVMVVAGIAISYFSSGALATFGTGLAMSGASMMAGSIYQMLSPQPKGLQGRDDPDNKPSYAFGGSVNTLAMGNPVALLYGEREIGARSSVRALLRKTFSIHFNLNHRINKLNEYYVGANNR